MRATIRGNEVEGTPEEVARLIALLEPSKASEIISRNGPRRFVPADVMFKMIKRRPISEPQRELLKKLRDKFPEWTSAGELQKATGYNKNQLSGLLGAFGKRAAATEGFEEGMTLFDYEWSYDDDCYFYRLAEDTREGVLRAKL